MFPNKQQTTEPDAGRSVWDRLRACLEQMNAAESQQKGAAVLAEKLAKRAQILRGRARQVEPECIPLVFLAFSKGRERFGLPIDDVLEVQTLHHFTPAPHAPPFIPGVIHWRGAILSLLDLGKLFGLRESGIADVHACIIVEAAGQRVALVAGDVDDICSVPRNQVQPIPELPGDIPSEWVLGVHDDNRMILKIDLLLADARLVAWRNK
jgi:purine-binding chemotaxis protein CheW